MSELLSFLNENAEWLFGSSSVAAIVVALVRNFLKKRETGTVPEAGSAAPASVAQTAGRDILRIHSDPTKIVFYLSLVIVFVSGVFLANNLSDDRLGLRDGANNSVNSGNSNVIKSGDNSTNTIATGGSDVSN